MSAVLEALHKAVARENLSAAEAYAALEEILGGGASESAVAGLLTALRMKGETVDEVVGFARALRDHATRVECGDDPRPLVDTCGTGGDGAQTFNISTASAFVVAGAGARVAKHGNRSISSACGSADVLEELGARLALEPARIARCVDEVGIGFLYAPALQPAMRHVQPIRAALKMRTVFNLLGPLANPAGAQVQVVGVYHAGLVKLVAEALAKLGIRRGLVVHGSDGLDEISTTGATLAAEVGQGRMREHTLGPEDFGVVPAAREKLAGSDRIENASIVRGVLGGEKGPRRDIVLVNAAAALKTAGLAADWGAGMALARESIDSGRALETLTRFIRFTQAG
ncbi:MAG TPA: anthranilate phosphoribosyltransferase [Bryobacterales bacterium]|nr:anthranilate phosphoribosyltransferase [Bryobacterales bacterium]